MKKIYLISGKAESGKTLASKILTEKLNEQGLRVKTIPFAMYLKIMMKEYYDWDGVTKDAWFRSLAQNLGTDRIRHSLGMETFHCDRVVQDIKVIWNDFDVIIIDDCRFLNEAYTLLREFPYITEIIRVRRPCHISKLTDEQLKHISECDMDNFGYYNHILEANNEEELKNEIDFMLNNK